MGRRIYVIRQSAVVDSVVTRNAQLAGCTEIVRDIPSALAAIIKESDLPLVYEEPSTPATSPIDLIAMINANTLEINSLLEQVLTLADSVNNMKVEINALKSVVAGLGG